MKALLILPLLMACNSLPYLVTDKELERASQTAVNEAEEFALTGDTAIVAAARSEGIMLASYVPPKPVGLPPPMPPGPDWAEILTLAITAIGGSAGAIGYRALDHRKKAAKARVIEADAA